MISVVHFWGGRKIVSLRRNSFNVSFQFAVFRFVLVCCIRQFRQNRISYLSVLVSAALVVRCQRQVVLGVWRSGKQLQTEVKV